MIIENRMRETWNRDVNVFVARTNFAKRKLTEGGLDPRKIVVKPNFIRDPGLGGAPKEGAVYMGRLSPEKGLLTLVDAWQRVQDVHLDLFGGGPLRQVLAERISANRLERVQLKGPHPKQTCLDALRNAGFLVLPSECYEMFPGAIVDAFALGRPVVASRSGSIPEIVEDGHTGLLFEPTDGQDLANKVRAMADDAGMRETMGAAARQEYEKHYSPNRYLEALFGVYEMAMATKGLHTSGS